MEMGHLGVVGTTNWYSHLVHLSKKVSNYFIVYNHSFNITNDHWGDTIDTPPHIYK